MAQPEAHTGQLHIFLGAAPGVGKTWAMVDAAQQKKAEGFDVVIGHVRTDVCLRAAADRCGS